MTNPVNPPPQLRTPKAFLNDREVISFFDQQRTILFQLWQKSGGSTDSNAELAEAIEVIEATLLVLAGVDVVLAGDISTNTTNISTNLTNIGTNTTNIATNVTNIGANTTAIGKVFIENGITAIAITAVAGDFMVCTNSGSINVTLPASPSDGDEVIIKATNAQVVIIGTIDGVTNKTITAPIAARCRYVDTQNWQVI